VGANVDPFRDLPRLGTFSDALPDDLPPGPADRYVGRRRAAADDPGRRR
jgi:hypothetical protein